jgi:hypothetical protein
VEVTAAGVGGSTARLGIFNTNTDYTPGVLVVDAGSVAVDANAVVNKTVTQALTPGNYLMAFNATATCTVRILVAPSATGISSTLGTSALLNTLTVDEVIATYPTPGSAWTTMAQGTNGLHHIAIPRVSVTS